MLEKIKSQAFAKLCPLIALHGWRLDNSRLDAQHQLHITNDKPDAYQKRPLTRISQAQVALDKTCAQCIYHANGDVLAKSSADEGNCYSEHDTEPDSHPRIGINIR